MRVLFVRFFSGTKTFKFISGTYIFKMAINPEYKVPEITFENNAALCTLYYR